MAEAATAAREFRAPVLVLHGGCGGVAEKFDFAENKTLSLPATSVNQETLSTLQGEQLGVRAAAIRGWQVLKAGGSAIDAVEQAVVVMEDDPEFNAGIGASLTRDKQVEMDALIMEGESLRMGAVCSVKNVRNPVRLARHVMERCEPHVMFCADEARRLAEQAGLQMLPTEQFYSAKSLRRWTEADKRAHGQPSDGSETRTGTVGAVAMDLRGLLASATSTGGLTYKQPGRVGDTPLVGCGGFADNHSAAVSATGIGETIMRTTLCRLAASFVENSQADAQKALELALAKLRQRLGVGAGLIAVDRHGVPGVHYTTEYMTWAVVESDGTLHFGAHPQEHFVEKLP